MIAPLACGHVVERSGDYFAPQELCPMGDGWQVVLTAALSAEEAAPVTGSLTEQVAEALAVPPPVDLL